MEITVPVLPDSFEKIYETLVRLLNGILSSTYGTAEMEKRLIQQELYLLLLKLVNARACVCVRGIPDSSFLLLKSAFLKQSF